MEKVHVYTDGGKSVAVADQTLYFDFELPEAYPENFFYLIWWPEDGFCAYFTQENGSQQRFDLEPTEENYAGSSSLLLINGRLKTPKWRPKKQIKRTR